MNRREAVSLPRWVPKAKPEPRQPDVVVLLGKAKEWKRALETTTGLSRAALGRQVGTSGQRVGHMVWLATRIAPQLESLVVALPPGTAERVVTVKQLARAARCGGASQQTLSTHIRRILVERPRT